MLTRVEGLADFTGDVPDLPPGLRGKTHPAPDPGAGRAPEARLQRGATVSHRGAERPFAIFVPWFSSSPGP